MKLTKCLPAERPAFTPRLLGGEDWLLKTICKVRSDFGKGVQGVTPSSVRKLAEFERETS